MANKQPWRIKTITEFHRLKGLTKPEHPLVSVVDFGAFRPPTDIYSTSWVLDFYSVSLKRGNTHIKYGQQKYDFDEGVMFFLSPGQVFKIEAVPGSESKPSGWMLLVHPDFLWNTPLAKNIKRYEYFGYSVNEALFLSEKEQRSITDIIQNIQQEYHANLDKFSQDILIAQIELLLKYSERFYQRQFITRKISNHAILDRLEELLADHFSSDDPVNQGLPSVQSIADALHVSPNYLSGLLKALTGQSTQQHIHEKLIEKAREKLSTTDLSMTEIAYELGFEHPQSFSKFFKTKTNLSPSEFRHSFHG